MLGESPSVEIQVRERNSYETLRIEPTGLEKRNAELDLEARSPQAGGVRHQRDQRAVGVASGHAQYERRSNLGGKAEIHDPNLAPDGRPQRSGFSRRSRDRKTWSAAATNSSSDGAACSERATRRSSAATTSSCSVGGSPSKAARTASAPRLMNSDSHRCSFQSRCSVLAMRRDNTQISCGAPSLAPGPSAASGCSAAFLQGRFSIPWPRANLSSSARMR